MASGRMRGVVRELRQRALSDSTLSDGELLGRYLAAREDAAFAALVRRHGPMVLGVCRRIVGNPHDADDAFQATFLVLVRRAACIKPRERVGAWLYGVAYRTALKAKVMSQRRRGKQQPLGDLPASTASTDSEWLALLDRAIQRLPDKYRLPIVLCDLEGKTRKQAAASLGWPEGTVATRLRDGRALVQKRLARHGLAATGAAAAFAWGQALSAITVPAPLGNTTIQLASTFASGKAAGLIPLNVLALTQGVLQAMMFTKVKSATAIMMLLAVLGAGLHRLAGQDGLDGDRAAPTERRPASSESPAPTQVQPASTLEENNGKLPTGPAPVQALVSLDKNTVVVRTNQPTYRPRTVVDSEQQTRTMYEVAFMLRADRHNKRDVEVYDTQRRKLGNKDWEKRLKKEIPALVVFSGRDIDPLHLRLIKEDTLIVLAPGPVPQYVPPTPTVAVPQPAVPPPAATAVWPAVAVPPGSTPPGPPPTAPAVPAVPPSVLVPQPAPSIRAPAAQAVPPPPPLAPQLEPTRPQRTPDATRPPAPPPLTPPPSVRRDATITEAERDMDIAAFYLKAGKRESAAFYYELVCRRWQGTTYAERAMAALQELGRPFEPAPKAAARIGQIIITGNNNVPDNVIRRELPLYPGQVLNYSDLRKAEETLRSMKEVKSEHGTITLRPTITVLEADGEYKDILVNVQEAREPGLEQSKSDIPDEYKKASFVLDLPFKGLLLAFDACAVLPDGRIKLSKAFMRLRREETNDFTVVRARHIYITTHRPVNSFAELSAREIQSIQVDGAEGIAPVSSGKEYVTPSSSELKLLQGVWSVTAATLDGKSHPTMIGGALTFTGEQLVIKTTSETSRYRVVLESSGPPRRLRLMTFDEPLSRAYAAGTYEVAGDKLTLSIQAAPDDDLTRPMVKLTLKRQPSPSAPTGSAVQVWRESVPNTDNAGAPIRFEDRAKGLSLTADAFKILPGNRVLLTKCHIRQRPQSGPEQSVRAERVLLTLDGLIQTIQDLSARKIISIQLEGGGLVEGE